MAQHRALSLLFLANKARRLAIGEKAAEACILAGKARLILAASDCAGHTLRKLQGRMQDGKQFFLQTEFTKQELGGVLGESACAIVTITEIGFAEAFVKALDQPAHAELLQQLTEKVQRTRKREKKKQQSKRR